MVVLDHDTDYNRYSLRLGRQDDVRKPHEVIYTIVMIFLGLLYLTKPHIFIIVVIFWIMLGLGVLFCFISVLARWKRSIDAARFAKETVVLERMLMRQLEENAERELERLSRRETTASRRDLISSMEDVSSLPSPSLSNQQRTGSRRKSSKKQSIVNNKDSGGDIEILTFEDIQSPEATQSHVTRGECVSLSGLNISKYHNSSSPHNENHCSICLSEFDPNDKVNFLFCTHVFHDSCMEQWLQSNSDRTCPICRQPVASDI
jgi:hypothetical protein